MGLPVREDGRLIPFEESEHITDAFLDATEPSRELESVCSGD